MTNEGEGLTMMVVEDNDFQRAVAAKVLEDLGCEHVMAAVNGQDALEQIVAYPDKVHIVISDLDMPEMDGVELLRHLAERKLADAMVVASALDAALIHTVEDMAEEHGLQVLTNVKKPVTRDKIRSVIEQYRKEKRVRNPDSFADVFTPEDIQDGLDAGQFQVWYQPKVRLSDGVWVASEALARWVHPDHGVIMPGRFVPVMEKSSLIDQLTWKQIHSIVEDLRDWQLQGRDLSVAVNLSPLLLEDVSMPQKLEEILAHHGVSTCRLTLEITESVLMKNLARSLETLARLRIKGFSLSIDDFGTGFSNFQQLNRIPFTELKIDRTFVKDITTKPSSRVIVESNIEMAKKLSLSTVAEGIETPDEWREVKGLNCDLAQGFLIARAMPFSQLLTWERGWKEQFKDTLTP